MKTKGTIILLLTLFLNSCVIENHGSIYDPLAPPMPLHQEKGETIANISYGGYIGLNGNASYAFTDNLAISIAGNYNPQKWKTPDLGFFGRYKVKHNSHGFETSIGYFSPRPNLFGNAFEIYGGFGLGQTDRKDYHTSENFYLLKGDFRNIFLQVNIGQVEEKVEYGFGMRFSKLWYPELQYSGAPYYNTSGFSENLNNSSLFYWTPMVSATYGFNYVGFNGNLGYAVPFGIKTKSLYMDKPSPSLIFCLGAKFRIN